MKRSTFLLSATLLFSIGCTLSAADIFVSLKTGKNKNAGTPEAPLKNIWKAVEKAAPGDVIHVAEGVYPGKTSRGWIEVNKPISIIGGYSSDFSQRNVLQYRTMLQPTNKQNATKPVFGTLTINTRNADAKSMVVIDGLIFDHTYSNNYHAVEGKPAGFADGMLTIPPAKGKQPNPTMDRYLLHANTDGVLIIKNCLFLNGSNYAVNVQHFSGQVQLINNVFAGNRMVGAEVRTTNGKPYMVEYVFAYNTVLFTWTRTKSFEDMGYGVRANEGVISKIYNNIFGLNCMAGFDNTKGNPAKKKVSLDNNVFFLNKKADVAITVSPNIQFMKADEEGFEDLGDLDGMESAEGNIVIKDPAVFKNVIDSNYLQAFLNATYTEKVDYDPNSPVNQFRAAFGMNKQGSISSKVSMYANCYPMESALKFFGALKDFGAQPIK